MHCLLKMVAHLALSVPLVLQAQPALLVQLVPLVLPVWLVQRA